MEHIIAHLKQVPMSLVSLKADQIQVSSNEKMLIKFTFYVHKIFILFQFLIVLLKCNTVISYKVYAKKSMIPIPNVLLLNHCDMPHICTSVDISHTPTLHVPHGLQHAYKIGTQTILVRNNENTNSSFLFKKVYKTMYVHTNMYFCKMYMQHHGCT